MPLTAKGEEIKSNMEKEYGPKKGESVFYASANKGTIKGVHNDERTTTMNKDQTMPDPATGPMSTKGPSAGKVESLPDAATPSSTLPPRASDCAMSLDEIRDYGKSKR